MKIHQTARKWIALTSSLVAFAAGSAYATDQALLDALVRKGVLTEKEATAIEQEVSKEAIAPAPGSESKIKLGDWVKELKLYGDLRLRYQYDDSQPQIPKAPLQTNYVNVSQRSRWRFRLRLNADFKLADNFFGGFGLQTNNAADSANQTYTGGFDNYNIYINKAFLGYIPIEGVTLIAGKQANPFYTTDLFWDPDINPQGIVERIDFHKLFDLSFGEPAYAKDGKAPVAPLPEPSPNALELSLIAGQFIFYDNNEFNEVTRATGNIKNDAYEFETQLLARLKLGKNFSFTVAPAVFITNNAEVGSAGNPAIALNNEHAFNGSQRDELILLAPGDVSFKVGVAYNLTDFAVFAVTGYLAWNLTDNLFGGAANSFANPTGVGIARDNATNVLQVDLSMQF